MCADDRTFAVPVFLDEPTGADRKDELILGGVPICRGVLKQGGWFTLAGDANQFRLEGTPAAYWPDGSVKWLHLCGLADLAGGRRNEFTLTPAGQSDPALGVQTDNGCVEIRGGELDADVRADARNVLALRHRGRALLKRPGLSAVLRFVAPDGRKRRKFPLRFDGEPQVVVATANRVVVRLPGVFRATDGRDAGELILFVEIYRQCPEVRLQAVYINLGQPQEDLIAELSLTAHTVLRGEGAEYGLANERGRGFWDVLQRIKADERGGDGPRWPLARQVQLGSSFYVTEKRTGADSGWVKAVEGRRSQGWCHLSGPKGGVTAAMRYFWQEYPRSLAIDADRGTITFGLIPSEAPPLDLRRYSQTIYGAAVYEAGSGPFPKTHGATGIAKAHELMLRFDTAGPADAPQRGLFFANPCRPLTPPEHFAETKAIGQLAPPRGDRHQGYEALAAEIVDFVFHEREVRGWYGLMNFGDVVSSYYADLDRWAFDDGGYAWINTEGLPDYGLWIAALRSGRTDWLAGCIEMTRHNRDVDMYHRGLLRGLGTRHNVNHWGCHDKEWRVSMPLVKRLHYYVTADPWTAEVIRETVAIYQSYVRTRKIAPSMTSAFAGILVKWEMTNDPADAKTLAYYADAIARAVRDDGLFTFDLHVDIATGIGEPRGDEPFVSHFFMNGFGGQHALVEYAEVAGCEALSDAIVKHMDYYVPADEAKLPDVDHRHRSVGTVMPFLAHAYRRTGRERYKDAIAEAVAKLKANFDQVGGGGILDEPVHKVLPDFTRRNKVACWLAGTLLHQPPYGLAVLNG